MLCIFALLSCGIEEYYYLPQVPESRVVRSLNNGATIDTSNVIDPTEHYYATGYIIYYKIYISDFDSDNIDSIISNNSGISSDFSSLSSFTNPANSSSIPSITTFSGRGFYELELEGKNIRDIALAKSGGFFRLFFPTSIDIRPYLDQDTEENGNEYSLYRSNGRGTFNPVPDRYFFSSTQLNDYANATSTINADVLGQSGISEIAYALMYIVAVGQDPNTFSRIYGKPTFISVFKLTKSNN